MRLVSVVVACVLHTSLAFAQFNTGEIGGIARDTSGGVLAGVAITAAHSASGAVVERVTDADGRYFLPGLRIGRWEIAAALAVSRPQKQTLVLEVGRTLALDFTLGVQASALPVVVEATAPLLQTTNAEISDVIENREVVQLPLNGRNFINLAQLSDGVVIPPGGTRGGALGQAGQLPNVGGQRSGHNIYLVDGAKVTDELFNNLVLNPSIDSIEEFKIQKSMYPAEFGGKASALINVVTRAGSNAFRGSLFEFHRNEAFDSKNFFQSANQPLPPLRQNQFGGALAAPSFQPHVLLRQLRRHEASPLADDRLLGAHGCRAERQLRRPRQHLRSADDSDDRRLSTVRQQPDSREPHRPDCGGISPERAAAERERQRSRISPRPRN